MKLEISCLFFYLLCETMLTEKYQPQRLDKTLSKYSKYNKSVREVGD